MLIHRIRLTDVLSFGPSSQELKLEPLNVVIGPNGSGKSNLIEAIGLLKAAPRDLHAPIRDGGGVHDWIWRGDATGGIAQVEVVLSYGELRALRYTLTFLEKGQRFRVNSEELRPEHPDSVTSDSHFSTDGEMAHVDFVDLGSANEEVRMWAKDIRSDQSIFAQVRGPNFPQLTYTAEQFERIRLFREWSFGRLTPARLPQKADLPNDFLAEDGANLGLVLNRLELDPKSKSRLLKALRELYEGVDDYRLSVAGGTVQIFLQEGNITIPATRLSDGTLRYLSLLAILCHPRPPPLVCIEEPELGLHPDIIPGLAELLREASRRCQLTRKTISPSSRRIFLRRMIGREACVRGNNHELHALSGQNGALDGTLLHRPERLPSRTRHRPGVDLPPVRRAILRGAGGRRHPGCDQNPRRAGSTARGRCCVAST